MASGRGTATRKRLFAVASRCDFNCRDVWPVIAPRARWAAAWAVLQIARRYNCAADLPDVSKCFRRIRSKHPCQRPPCYFAWGCFRYFSWEREPRRPCGCVAAPRVALFVEIASASSSPSTLSLRSSYAGHHASPFGLRVAAPRVARRAKRGGPGRRDVDVSSVPNLKAISFVRELAFQKPVSMFRSLD